LEIKDSVATIMSKSSISGIIISIIVLFIGIFAFGGVYYRISTSIDYCKTDEAKKNFPFLNVWSGCHTKVYYNRGNATQYWHHIM